MNTQQMKPKDKSFIEKLAPAYILIALITFVGLIISNIDNLRDQQLVEIGGWLIGGGVAALITLAFVANHTIEESAQTNPERFTDLRIVRWLLGMILLIPAALVAGGLDLSQAIGTYYVNHGHADAVYQATGLMPSAGLLYEITIGLSVPVALYLFILGRTPLISAISLLKLFIAIAVAVPMVFLLFMTPFAYGAQGLQ